MTGKRAYSYTILRYVHDVVSGEALNVGVVMHMSASQEVQMRTNKTIGRLRGAFPDLDRRAFVSAMEAIDRSFRAVAGRLTEGFRSNSSGWIDARTLALSVLPADDSALQWSLMGTGLTDDFERTFDDLYERYVARHLAGTAKPPTKGATRRRTDEEIWRPVRDRLAHRGIDISFEPRKVAGAHDWIEFSRAWKNGRWHAYEPLSMDLADADGIKDKARRWRGHLAAVAEGTSEQVDLHFLLGRPQNAMLNDAYETAKAILQHAPFAKEVVDEDNVDDLVASIEQEYRGHGPS